MLESSLILLRAPEPEDLDLFYKWENNTGLWKYGSTIAPFSLFTLKEYIARSGGDFFSEKQLRLMIVLKENNEVAGHVDIFDFDPFHRRAAMGVLIDEKFQKRGIATEAIHIAQQYAFDFLGLNMLYVHVPEKNVPSVSLFSKVGYEKTGHLKSWLRVGKSYEDVIFMQNIRKD